VTQITGGKISFGRTIQAAQFEPKRADAEFTFTVSEGGDVSEIAIKAAMLAYSKVHELLGLKTEIVTHVARVSDQETKAVTQHIPPAGVTVTAPADKSPIGAEGEKRSRGRPPKQPPVVEPDPASIEDEEKTLSKGNGGDPGAAEWAADDEPAEVTDARLLEAVTKRNGVINNGAAIKRLIRTYNNDVPGSRLDQIPQAKRGAFLVELEKLQPEKPA
jgi:hypothetical protein